LNTTRGEVEQVDEGEGNSDEDNDADEADETEEENNLAPEMPPAV
jgi:hypothetical protein